MCKLTRRNPEVIEGCGAAIALLIKDQAKQSLSVDSLIAQKHLKHLKTMILEGYVVFSLEQVMNRLQVIHIACVQRTISSSH